MNRVKNWDLWNIMNDTSYILHRWDLEINAHDYEIRSLTIAKVCFEYSDCRANVFLKTEMYILFIRVQKLVMFYCKFKVKQVSAVFITRLMKIQRDHKTIYDLVSHPTVERKADAALLRFVFAFSAEPIYLITYNDAMRLRCTFRFRRQQRMHATSPTLYVWCESV